MMNKNIKVTVTDGAKTSVVEMEEVTDAMQHKVLDGMFRVFGVYLPTQQSASKPFEARPLVDVRAADIQKLQTGEVTVVKPAQPGITASEVVQKAYNSSVPPIADPRIRVYNKTDVPEGMNSINEWLEAEHAKQSKPGKYWHKTGIKYKNDKPAFKCIYKCNKCEAQSFHYIWEGTVTVDCHQCQTTLQVKKAAPGVHGLARDPQGNFFIAGNLAPMIAIKYAKSTKGYAERF